MSLVACGKSAEESEPAELTADTAPTSAVDTVALSGEAVFKRCIACHKAENGAPNGIGPNLHAIVGKAVASAPGFNYSAAMKAKGGVWDEAALDDYLAHPAKTIPGTRMAFAGLSKEEERKAVIEYLQSQK